jgi:hypothetical protein
LILERREIYSNNHLLFMCIGVGMASQQDSAEVEKMIQAFYRFAGIPISFNLQINERVAEVFGKMLDETKRCSNAFVWVPKPPSGRASIAWLIVQLGRGAFASHESKLSIACARRVIQVWGTSLQMASMGLSERSAAKWG